MAYDIRIIGITIAGTQKDAEATINARFGPDSIAFRVPVGPIGVDSVTHWSVCSKSRTAVLGVFASETRKLHQGPGTSVTAGGTHQTITRDADGAILGAWSTYTGGFPGWNAWLAGLGLEVKTGSVSGDQPIDTIIALAQAAEDALP